MNIARVGPRQASRVSPRRRNGSADDGDARQSVSKRDATPTGCVGLINASPARKSPRQGARTEPALRPRQQPVRTHRGQSLRGRAHADLTSQAGPLDGTSRDWFSRKAAGLPTGPRARWCIRTGRATQPAPCIHWRLHPLGSYCPGRSSAAGPAQACPRRCFPRKPGRLPPSMLRVRSCSGLWVCYWMFCRPGFNVFAAGDDAVVVGYQHRDP